MLNIYLCVCVCAPAIGFHASTYNRFRDFYYICSVFLPKAKPRACIPIVIIHSFILILVVSTIFFSLSLFFAHLHKQHLSITFQAPFSFVPPSISMVLFINTNTKHKLLFCCLFFLCFFSLCRYNREK